MSQSTTKKSNSSGKGKLSSSLSSSSQSLFAYLRVKKVGEINASVEEHRKGAQVTVNEVTKIATKRATFAATDEKAGDQNGKRRSNRIKAAKITKFAKGTKCAATVSPKPAKIDITIGKKRAATDDMMSPDVGQDAKRRKIEKSKSNVVIVAAKPQTVVAKKTVGTIHTVAETTNQNNVVMDVNNVSKLKDIVIKQSERILELEEELKQIKSKKLRNSYTTETKALAASYVINQGLHLRDAGEKSGVNKEVIRQTVLATDPNFFKHKKRSQKKK